MTDTASLPNASAEAGTDSQVTVVTNRSSVSERVLSIVIPIFMVLLAIAAWQAHIMINEVPRYIMPAPLDVVNALWTDWGTLSPSLLVTLRITVMALGLALLGGVGLAIILVQSRWIELALFPFAVILQVTPMIAIAPLLIIYMPDTQSALLTCAFVVAFFPILSNMVAGLKSVDHNLLNLFELYGASRWQTLIHLKLPSSLPYFAAGLRIGGGLSLIAAVVAEFAAGSAGKGSGLAFRLLESGYRLNYPRLYAALVLLMLTGVAIFALTSLISWAMLHRWHESALKRRIEVPITIPADGHYAITNASVPVSVLGDATSGDLAKVDITIADGKIAAIGAPGSATLPQQIDLRGDIVLPAFVDLHTHLDKGHIWARKENPDGTWLGALMAVLGDREANWAASDVERRMDFSLRCAYAHGTAAIRTHLDMAPPQHDITWDVFEAMRERWAGRIELQAAGLMGPDTILDAEKLRAVATRTKASGGILGGSTAVHPENPTIMRKLVEMAGELGLDIDLHTDESPDPKANALECLADAAIESGFTGSVVAGHCCSLAVQDSETAKRVIDKVARAGIAVVSLPMCNMYLQDRDNKDGVRTPRWRGVTLVNELKAAGVKVAIASDNTRDPFYAYGDLDGFEVFREGARILHFDHPQTEAFAWARVVSADPGAIAGFGYTGELAVGAPADLVLFKGRTWTELMSRPQADRIVIRAGQAIDTTLPDYRELDDLMGLS